MEELSNLEKRVLKALGEIGDVATPEQLLERSGLRELVQVMNASSWLQAKGLVRHEETMRTFVGLGKEGEEALRSGLPERRVVRLLQARGGAMPLADLQKDSTLAPGEANVATGWLRRKGMAEV